MKWFIVMAISQYSTDVTSACGRVDSLWHAKKNHSNECRIFICNTEKHKADSDFFCLKQEKSLGLKQCKKYMLW